MNIKDIVNRDIVNLENCEQEPIHIPGSIQPHGFLLGINAKSFEVEYCSGNTDQYLSLSIKEILGKKFANVFGDNAHKKFLSYIKGPLLSDQAMQLFQLQNRSFHCHIHISENTYIFEAEPENKDHILDVYGQTKKFLTNVTSSNTLQALCQGIAESTREITGYDRVMIYRFDENHNGEVFAEDKREDLEPFIGLHYPSTDIPAQARKLYLKNLVRLIADIGYEPVPIYTLGDRTNSSLDMSLSILRSTSPIHVQYLQNMGVGATLTISLIHNGALWGLIACHHYSPKVISPEIKVAAQLQGHFLTSQIDTRQQNEEYELSRKANAALENLLMIGFPNNTSDFEKLAKDPNLLLVCNASGVAVLMNDKIFTGGEAPVTRTILGVAEYIKQSGETEFITSNLQKHLPGIQEICDTAAGVICHPLSDDKKNCIIWFRKETVCEVHWAGDPSTAINKDSKGLSPRNSFALWKETVKCTSQPWKQPETMAAAQLAHNLQKHVLLLMISEEERKYRELSTLLQEANAELENINWISAHDLQEPLRKVQIFSSRLLSDEMEPLTPQDQQLYLERINRSANRMQRMLSDILKYTKAEHSQDNKERVQLNEIVNRLDPEMLESIKKTNGRLTVSQLPEISGIPFLLDQLFSNLMSNAIKFSRKGKPLNVEIKYEGVNPAPEGVNDKLFELISFTDNGTGFEPQFEEKIFQVFYRLQDVGDKTGTGIGLALCRKIMRKHGGFIKAKGNPGKGARFELYFPSDN